MKVGDIAPDFSLSDQTGQVHNLSRLVAHCAVVLMFYPYDQSPDCAEQLCAANAELAQFRNAGVQLFGINNASAESHEAFAHQKFLQMSLLSDDNYRVAKLYDCLYVIGPIKVIRRTVVGISRGGQISYYQRGMDDGLGALSVLTAAGQA